MPDTPAAHGPGPKSPPPDRPHDTPPTSAWLKRSTLKTLAPLALAVLGLALLVAALKLYPRTTERPTPSFANLYVTTTARIASVTYTVRQVSPTLARVRVSVNSDTAPHAGTGVTLALEPPPGTFFHDCPHPACTISAGRPGYAYWAKHLTFRPAQGTNSAATADFFVKAGHFGASFDGVNAYAAIPDITYQGPGRPYLEAAYHIPSAASYDWSSVPTEEVDGSVAVWEEPISPGERQRWRRSASTTPPRQETTTRRSSPEPWSPSLRSATDRRHRSRARARLGCAPGPSTAPEITGRDVPRHRAGAGRRRRAGTAHQPAAGG